MQATTDIRRGAAPVTPPAAADPRGSHPLRLFRRKRRWVVRLFETVLPRPEEGPLALGAADLPLGAFVDDLVTHAPLSAVLGLRLALWLVMLAPPFALGRWRTFLGLDPAERLALLERLRRSDRYLVRESALMWKLLGCLGFCGLPEVQRRLGIHPVDQTPPAWVPRP